MSKRNIRPNSGKQLYLNQIFSKGMLYTSSEMPEGYAKVIDNFDIAPTGDAASPRNPFKDIGKTTTSTNIFDSTKYIYPAKFKQCNYFSYIEFLRTITESQFANDTDIPEYELNPTRSIRIVNRDPNELNESTPEFTTSTNLYNKEYYIPLVDQSPTTDPYEEYREDYIEEIESTTILLSGATTKTPKLVYRVEQGSTTTYHFYYYYNYYGVPQSGVPLITYSVVDILSKDYVGFQSIISTTSTITVIDGDTFDVQLSGSSDKTRYRLYGIDCTELNHNVNPAVSGAQWSMHAKKILENIISCVRNNNYDLCFNIKNTSDSYGRVVIELFGANFDTSIGKYRTLNINELILSLGLAIPRYFNEDDTATKNEYLEYNTTAKNTHRKIYTEDDFDPYYNELTDPSEYDFETSDGDNLQMKEKWVIEAVKINSDNNYSISAKTTVTTDFIKCIYIDYMDAVGFIGRIIDMTDSYSSGSNIDNSDKIIYKGLILVKAYKTGTGNNDIVYTITLPSNNGAGVQPDLVSAASGGLYNLYNNYTDPDGTTYEIINVKNITKTTYPLSIIGCTTLACNDTLTDARKPVRVLNEVTTGTSVLLRAILYENGYYNYTDISSTDNWGFEITGKIIITTSEISTGNVLYLVNDIFTINKSINEYSNVSSISLALLNSMPVSSWSSTDRASITNYITASGGTSIEDLSWEDIFTSPTGFTNNVTFQLISIKLIKNDSTVVSVTSGTTNSLTYNFSGTSTPSTPTRVWSDCLLEMVTQTELDTDYTNTSGDILLVNIHNNFASIKQNLTITGTSIDLVNRTDVPKIDFFSQWFKSEYGTTDFVEIEEAKKLYYVPLGGGSIQKYSNYTWSSDTIIQPSDLIYQVNEQKNLTFKYSIQPKYLLDIHSGSTNNCPSALRGLYYVNTYTEMYQTIPILEVGDSTEYISSEKLSENMDIRNATRLDIFNRQICLYGPYTISNALFFSKFEKFDYYPSPSHVIELDEPIIWVYNYKDSFIVFGKYSIYMLHGGTAITDCSLVKLYENLSIHLEDVRFVNTYGNNIIFFNSGVGYVISPNQYVDNTSSIRVYKLTENINNFFYNPDEYIRSQFPDDIGFNDTLSYNMEFLSYVENNNIIIVDNVTINKTTSSNGTSTTTQLYLPVFFIYNQDYKYWRMYSTKLFKRILSNYICEPNLNNQFVITNTLTTDYINKIAYMVPTLGNQYKDIDIDDSTNVINITTNLNTGYLSVDTMNDKRFKDFILELDNIDDSAQIKIDCNFFVDSTPIILSDVDVLIVNSSTTDTDYILSELKDYDVHSINGTDSTTVSGITTTHEKFGKSFIITKDNTTYERSKIGRTHVRIPLFGKGRLPLFNITMSSDKFYEFINYALIYKEKDINRRS